MRELESRLAPAATLKAALIAGDVVIADGSGGAVANFLAISSDVAGGKYVILSSGTETFNLAQVTVGSVSTTNTPNDTLSVPFATPGFVGDIIFDTQGGNDELTMDWNKGVFDDAHDVNYIAGAGVSDVLVIKSGAFDKVTSNNKAPDEGDILMDPTGGDPARIMYDGIEPITLDVTMTIANLEFKFSPTTNTAMLEDNGKAGDKVSQFRATSGTFETTTFPNPTNSLMVVRGSALDTVTVAALPDYSADLTIGSAASPMGTLTFAGALTLASGADLTAFASGTISFPNAASDVSVSGTGSVALTTEKNITMASGSSVTGVNGPIKLTANGSVSGAYVGIDLVGASIISNGTGPIDLTGRGGTVIGGSNAGVSIGSTAAVTANGAGTILITGTGGFGVGTSQGFRITGGAVTTKTGNIQVTGIATAANNSAVDLGANGVLTSTAAPAVTLIGDSININTTSSLKAESSMVTLQPLTPILIGLGVADSAGTLGLTDAELDKISPVATLVIGDNANKNITVSAIISRPTFTPMQLRSGGDIAIISPNGQINTNGGTILLAPGSTGSFRPTRNGIDMFVSNALFSAGADVSISITGTVVDTGYTQFNCSGPVTLTGADLLLTGTYVPQPGDSFTIVTSTGLTGEFNGLTDNTVIPFNGKFLRINYVGNDVILSTEAAPFISSITTSSANGVYSTGQSINIMVNFSEPVTLAGGNLSLTLDSGAKVAVAPFSGASASVTYIVAPADTSPDLNVTAITLPGGATLQNGGAVDANLALPVNNLANNANLIVNPPSPVTGFIVNFGATQRSRLTAIQVNFSSPVNAATLTGLGAITLTRTLSTSVGTNGTLVQTGATGANGRISVSPSIGLVNSVTLTFSNADNSNETAGVEYGSLADGRWRLAIPSLFYQSVLNDPALRRLFGDGDSTGTVDAVDLASFGAAFGTSGGPNFSPYDYDSNGTVDADDLGAFGSRFGLTV